MVNSLIHSELLIGKNKEEVIEILGLEENQLEENSWLYWIDFRGIGESKFLRVKFDTNNKVEFVEKFNEA